MTLRLRIPLATIMLFMLLIMSVVPVWLIQVVIRNQVRANMETEVVRLTQGILDTAHRDLNQRLSNLKRLVDGAARADGRGKSLAQDLADACRGQKIDLASRIFPRELGLLLAIPLNTEEKSISIAMGEASIAPRPLDPVDPAKSDTFSILNENPDRSLWLGKVPLVDGLPRGIWYLREIRLVQGTYVVGALLDPEWEKSFLAALSAATSSSVWLITMDNMVLPEESTGFFDKPWAGKALSRTQTGRLINFVDHDTADSSGKEILVHVFADNEYLYNMVVEIPRDSLVAPVQDALNTSGLVIMIAGLLFTLASLGIVLSVSRRFRGIRAQFAHVADPGYPLEELPRGIGVREVEELVGGVADMRERLNQALNSLEKSRAELQRTNQGLEEKVSERTREVELSLKNLMDTQSRLVENEKMAILGRTASSFTHEINNPLGVSNLAVSQMTQALGELKARFEQGTLSQGYFTESMSRLQEAASIIERNLHQASVITTSFKHVATDQGSGKESDFDLGKYLEEVLTIISPKFHRTGFRLTLEAAPGIMMRCNPAVFYQIMTNLVNNSIMHGFEGRSSGLMTIALTQVEGSAVKLIYRDNGRGMTSDAVANLFKPFFTTKQGSGGSGLGLHIIHDLVQDVLGGTISCESVQGEGVTFTMTFNKAGGS